MLHDSFKQTSTHGQTTTAAEEQNKTKCKAKAAELDKGGAHRCVLYLSFILCVRSRRLILGISILTGAAFTGHEAPYRNPQQKQPFYLI